MVNKRFQIRHELRKSAKNDITFFFMNDVSITETFRYDTPPKNLNFIGSEISRPYTLSLGMELP